MRTSVRFWYAGIWQGIVFSGEKPGNSHRKI
jgi:hypothetical protein